MFILLLKTKRRNTLHFQCQNNINLHTVLCCSTVELFLMKLYRHKGCEMSAQEEFNKEADTRLRTTQR